MKKMIIFKVLLLVCIATNAYCLSTGKLTLIVKDEQGLPVEGAKAYISYSKPEIGGVGVADILKEGITGKDGLFIAESLTMSGVGISAEKVGYYTSNIHYEFTAHSKLLNRWEPWNPTVEVILKNKHNPVPMYDNHRTSYNVPKLDTPIGFDLEKEDWVTPYGKGTTSDFIINFNVVDRAYTDYECGFTLTFSNPRDGIQEYFFDGNDQSSFKWPFEAPDAGFLAQLSKRKTMTPGKGYKSDEKNNVNYLFRVRTIVDQNGNIIEAKYGKLVGEFGFVPNKQITFRYIFNPDGTRNLEEDLEKNLFRKK